MFQLIFRMLTFIQQSKVALKTKVYDTGLAIKKFNRDSKIVCFISFRLHVKITGCFKQYIEHISQSVNEPKPSPHPQWTTLLGTFHHEFRFISYKMGQSWPVKQHFSTKKFFFWLKISSVENVFLVYSNIFLYFGNYF